MLRFIILVMVLLSVANSVNMSLFERIGEFGTMRAVGDRGRKIFALVVTEGALLGLIGALLGVLARRRAGGRDLGGRHPDAAATKLQSRLHRRRSGSCRR